MTSGDTVRRTRAVHDGAAGTGRGRPPGGRGLRALRFLSGTVSAALVLLALVVAGASLAAGDRPGPGVGAIVGHAVVAVAALAMQFVADRRRDPVGVLAALLVFPLAAATLWFWWWS